MIGVAGGESASVDVDLVVYEFEVFLYLGELGGHVGTVGLHEGKSFLLVAVPGGYQLGVAADRLDGHPGGPQLGADGDPLQVELLVAAPSIGWLIAARALQAVGGTMLNPVALAIVAATFPDRAERARAIGVFGAVSGLSLGLGPILGGALVDGVGWRFVFWVNVPIVAAAIVCTALFVPESRAARARRFDPVGQILVTLVLGSVVFAVIESTRLGWTSPIILALLAVAVLGVIGIIGYEPRRVDPLLELRLFRSVPFSSAIAIALFALCGFGAFLFVTTQYLQDVRGMSALTAGLSLLPVGGLIVVLSPLTGQLVGAHGPRLPLVASGAALALAGGASLWLAPATPLPAVLAIYLLIGIFQGTINPPITNTAVAGMPTSMSGVAASLAHRPADRHHPGHRDLRNDRGIGPGPRRHGVHQSRTRRVVAATRARRRHPGPGGAQHRTLGTRHRRPGSDTVRGAGPGCEHGRRALDCATPTVRAVERTASGAQPAGGSRRHQLIRRTR